MNDRSTLRKRRWYPSDIAFIAGILVVIALVVLFWYRFRGDAPSQEAETDTILSDLAEIMILPQGEASIALITDAEDMRAQQAFFLNAEDGDMLIIFPGVQAIIYREREQKIIAVGPVVPQESAKAPISSEPVRVALYNGTTFEGRARRLEEDLVSAQFSFSTAGLANAARRDYVRTIVVDVTGGHEEDARAIARIVGGEIAALPSEERAPAADILIIAGMP